MTGIGAYYELEVACRGEADPVTGYLMNISAIDKAVRDHALPIITQAVFERPRSHPAAILKEVVAALQKPLHERVVEVRWRLNPYYSASMDASSTDSATIRQQFEFSASHRLHVAELSDAENRAIFGKCNNPNSHGHNYRVEPAVRVSISNDGQSVSLSLLQLEKIVDETIIQRFDHKHLNRDTVEFARLNPSVENIARVCYELLEPAIVDAGAVLDHVTVWETEKTSCRYPAG
jgi:6-pyruvoyltetrahydropterin/6-carboxytetrahydropterin synthase